MYLSKLEIFGFKSFAQKTGLKFTEGIACVIGPNGSGKSNIVDSIRWVLGEQKISTLRTDRMENVIFNGTNNRKPLGMAEVSLTIQNNKQILRQEFTEVVVTRRLYRSGESHYLINKAPCRLKDIQELFMDTGMGSDSYSVIELSMVENIISENPADRRHLFEEAAGVTKYKARRKSALRKLDSTLQDMNRINDIIVEIRRNVNSLSRQVGKARRYLEYKAELQKIEVDLARFRYTRLMDEIAPLQKQLAEISVIREDANHQITLEEALLEEYKREILQAEDQLQTTAKHLAEQDDQINLIKQEEAVAQTRSQALNESIKRNEKDIVDFTTRSGQLSEREKNLSDEIKEQEKIVAEAKNIYETAKQEYDLFAAGMQQEKAGIQELNTAYKAALDDYNSVREIFYQKQYQTEVAGNQARQLTEEAALAEKADKEIARRMKEMAERSIGQKEVLNGIEKELISRRQTVDDINRKINTLQTTLQESKQVLENRRAKKEFFEQLLTRYEGHTQATRFLMQNRQQFPGIHGPLSEMISVRDEFRAAVESALGETLDYVIVDTLNTARMILKSFSGEKHGRVTLLPLDLLESVKTPAAHLPSLKPLSGEVRVKTPYRKIIDVLLGDVYLVEDLESAIGKAGKNGSARFVTSEGELYQYPPAISGGASVEDESSLTGRSERLAALQKDIETIEKKIQKHATDIEEADIRKKGVVAEITSFESRRTEIINVLAASEKSEAQLNYEKKSGDVSAKERLLKIEALRRQISDYQKDLSGAEEELSHKKNLLEQLEEKSRQANASYDQKYNTLQSQSDVMQKKQVEYIGQQNNKEGLEHELNRTREQISELSGLIDKRKSEIGEMQTELKQIRDGKKDREDRQKRIWEQRDRIEGGREKIQQTYHELRDKILNLENQIKKFRKQHDSSVERSRQLELQIQENQMKSENLMERIREEYSADISVGIAFEGLEVEECEQQIETLKFKIIQLGQVNPLAVSEYEKENERLQFYEKQFSDLEEAEKSLRKTIQKINITARQQFLETFEQIKVNFEKVFGSFFKSGEGTLRLDEESDPLEANIEIFVRPKGKRVQTIYLLSGGEKTLTAISLLFAIYLVKPSPFCILDEIDAPLDDVNIGRFTQALRDFSTDTQFIVVTHNKRTMEAADTLYGVTMEEEGLSKLVSVKFN
jgi:chromosome segregation protein